MIKLTAEERAKRALDYSIPFLGDTVKRWGCPSDLEGMVEPEGMPTTTTINAVGRIVKEIHEAEEVAQREAMEKCVSVIEREEDLLEAMIAEGGLREEYTHNFNGLEAGAGAIRALIKEKE